MKNDLTLLYYSANAMDETLAENIRKNLLEVNNGIYPIISVTQKPVSLGENICVGELGQSYYNLYKQIFTGLQRVETKYVAFVEDDSLYNVEHFSHRPSSEDTFSYNKNIWFLEKEVFYNKNHVGGFATIAGTKAMIEALSQLFEKYPTEPLPRNDYKHVFVEPGKYTKEMGFREQKVEYFNTKIPLITLCHRTATCGWPKRRNRTSIIVVGELPDFGLATDLRKKLCQKSA